MSRHRILQRRMPECDRLALYAQYRDARSDCAPVTCDGGRQCWVRDGPPSLSANHGGANQCLGCGGAPLTPFRHRWPPP